MEILKGGFPPALYTEQEILHLLCLSWECFLGSELPTETLALFEVFCNRLLGLPR